MSAFNNKRITSKNYKSLGGFLLAGSNSLTEILLWALIMLPAGIVVSGAGICFTDIGVFVGTTFAWIFLVKRLKTYKDVSGDAMNNMWDFLYSRYHSELLRKMSAVIWFILVGMITSGILGFTGDMVYELTGINKNIVISVLPLLLVLIMYFTNNRMRSIFQSVFYILLALVFIGMIAWIFLSNSTSELLDTYGKARLSGGTSIYLNILYSDGEKLSTTRIISMLGMGFGCLGLPFLYAGAFKAKDNRELDRGRILSMIFSGILIVAICMWSLLIVACIYPLDVVTGTPIYEILNIFLILVLSEYEFSNVIINIIMVVIFVAVMCLLCTLFSMMYETIKSVASADKYIKKLKTLNLIDIICIVFFAAAVICSAFLYDNYQTIIKISWEYCSSLAASYIMTVVWKGTSKAGVISGLVSGIVACTFWRFVPFIEGETLADATSLSAGTASFVISFAILIIVSMFTHKRDESEDKIFKQIRLEQR